MRQLLFLSSDVMQWSNSWVAYPGVCATYFVQRSNLCMGTEIQQMLVRVFKSNVRRSLHFSYNVSSSGWFCFGFSDFPAT